MESGSRVVLGGARGPTGGMRGAQVGRAAQHVCALRIESAFKKFPSSWGAVRQLGAATSKEGETDFAEWENLVRPGDRQLVRESAGHFSRFFAEASDQESIEQPAPAHGKEAAAGP